MTAQSMYDAALETGRMAHSEAHADGPVYGPAAPTEADCAGHGFHHGRHV